MHGEAPLRSVQFRREREAAWLELEALVDQAEKKGLRSLRADQLERLPSLYRGAAGALSVARAVSLDRSLLDYLTALVARSSLCVYDVSGRSGAGAVFLRFFRHGFPAAVRAQARFLAAALLVFGLGLLTGWGLTWRSTDRERYLSLVGAELAHGRDPAASTEELRRLLYERREPDASKLGLFSVSLFAHNVKIGFLCFGLGLAAGLPVLYLLFAHGLTLGALAALYQTRGLGAEFWAWLLPHGVTEILALCLCGGAGLALGTGLIFPGPSTRLHSLARRGRPASLLVIGAVALFLIAGLLEGVFRQAVHNQAARWLVSLATLLFWTLYLFFAGRAE